MAFENCVFVLFGLCLCAANNNFVLGYGKPQILSEPEYVLERNGNHSFFCQGNRPLKWTVPEVDESKKSWTHFSMIEEQPSNLKFAYGLRLIVTNMTYPFVGYYYCHYVGSNVDSGTESEKIYLFVDDEEHLSLFENDSTAIETIIVTKGEQAVIPCKPTSPQVSVKLRTLTSEDDLLREQDTDYRYSERIGIITNDTNDEEKVLLCRFLREGSESMRYIRIVTEIPVSHLAMPDLKDISDGHTIVGDPLILRCQVKSPTTVDFQWKTPHGQVDERRMTLSGIAKDENTNMVWQELTINVTDLSDGGNYTCFVSDHQEHSSEAQISVKVFGTEENYIEVTEPNNNYYIQTYAGKDSIQWGVYVLGHPKPSVTWMRSNRTLIIPMKSDDKYEASFNENTKQAVLVIKNIDIYDMGYYSLIANNGYVNESKDFYLNVTVKPMVHISSELFYVYGTIGTINCSAAAYPEPIFSWEFRPCLTNDCPTEVLNGTRLEPIGLQFTSQVQLRAEQSGIIKCTATNINGTDETETGFFVSDIKDGFEIFGLDESVLLDNNRTLATIATDEKVTMTCGASQNNYTDIVWLYNGTELKSNDRYTIENSTTHFSLRSILTIYPTKIEDSGQYACRAESFGSYVRHNIYLNITDPVPPIITKISNTTDINLEDSFDIVCEVYGVPKPSIYWYKDGEPFSAHDSRVQISNDKQRLHFNKTILTDEGVYACKGTNKAGTVSDHRSLKFKYLSKSPTWLYAVIVILAILFIVAVAFIVIKVKKERDLQRELKKLGLSNFVNGAVESINPNLSLDDQAELLPYDKNFEFPIEQLKLGKQLGSGAFGVVMKGQAKNIVSGENVTVVAVKMVKKNADDTYIKALASELKIMVHLGKHLNVVNLLGACTKNVAKRELFVIVEYCRFGNLQNYLLRHRDNFINQVDKTEKIDYTIGQEYLDRTYSVSSNQSAQSPLLKYAALAFPNSGVTQVLPQSNSMGDYRANINSEVSANTQMTTLPQSEDGHVSSNNSVQPEWRSNYRGDYKGQVKPISTTDLLIWGFQVARGMEYLASRKVLHGDLAARNILLSDNNIVKICDFGLAKSMYKNDNYKKRGDCPLPLKWMAIESIRDRIFSTQSDVWSFGIVLWEFFSLGRIPYPGMEADERLYHKLVDGYRMDSPEYAPKEIYQMMSDCWSVQPLARPSFTKLGETIGNLLEESMRQHYIDLNDPYLKMNTQRLENGHDDYLAMVSPPTFEAFSSPHYINDGVIDQPVEIPGYMSMKPNMIFSPRVVSTDDDVFDFSINNRKQFVSEEGRGTEMLPMLHTLSESDSETPITPNITSLNSVSNPSYHHLPPSIPEETTNNNREIVKSADNYVNMPKNKDILKEKSELEINRSVPNKEVHHYVNDGINDLESVDV